MRSAALSMTRPRSTRPNPSIPFAEFYPFYLGEHINGTCRTLHFIGSNARAGCLRHHAHHAQLVARRPDPSYRLRVLRGGPFRVRENKPATFKYPGYSFMGDWVSMVAVADRENSFRPVTLKPHAKRESFKRSSPPPRLFDAARQRRLLHAHRPTDSPDSVPLNARGVEQARAAGRLFRDHDVRFDRIVTSGLPRTLETAARGRGKWSRRCRSRFANRCRKFAAARLAPIAERDLCTHSPPPPMAWWTRM